MVVVRSELLEKDLLNQIININYRVNILNDNVKEIGIIWYRGISCKLWRKKNFSRAGANQIDLKNNVLLNIA